MKPPRGTQDLLPPFSQRFQIHERTGGELFERAGYRRIITPMFEDTTLFVRGVGEGSDIVNKEMYTFTDRSDNSLTLRPEGTAPVIRAIISHSLWEEGLPIKLWYSAAMFRYDRPQKGRYRQHHQLGIEVVGSDDPAVDAEVLWIGREMLRNAGITDATLLLNSIGDPRHEGCRTEYGPELRAFLEQHRDELDGDCRRRMDTNPLRVFDCKVPRDQEILAKAPTIDGFLCAACSEHFETVQGYLKDLQVPFTLEPRLVRGLDYYTRTTFEFQTSMLEAAQNTVCGGGRYDLLSQQLGGPDLPGIGFGSGIERVLLAQEAAGTGVASGLLDCFIIPVSGGQVSAALTLAASMRSTGTRVDLAVGERSVKAHMKHANRLGARYAVIIGPDEQARDEVTLKDMTTGEQRAVARDQVATAVASGHAIGVAVDEGGNTA
ncbi:MAG TPA: histidine--tRNA ligase [Actinomycetota bacterium]